MRISFLILSFISSIAFATNEPSEVSPYTIPPFQDPDILPPTNGTDLSPGAWSGIAIGAFVGVAMLVGGTAAVIWNDQIVGAPMLAPPPPAGSAT
jgi:hypothetical protein